MQDFRNLDVWNRAHQLVLCIYKESARLPKDEIFGLTIQLRRTSIAVATRIAEGAGREGNFEFAGELKKAAALCNELEYLILLACDLAYWDSGLADSLTDDTRSVRRMIFGLIKSL